jgi:hypothetical protein
VDQQVLRELAGRNSLPHVPLPKDPLPEANPEGSLGEESTTPRAAEEAMVVVFGLGSGSCVVRFLCLNLFVSGIDYYTCRDVFGLLRVNFICVFWIVFRLFIVLCDITHVVFWHLRACKEPPGDGVETN